MNEKFELDGFLVIGAHKGHLQVFSELSWFYLGDLSWRISLLGKFNISYIGPRVINLSRWGLEIETNVSPVLPTSILVHWIIAIIILSII